MWRNDFFNKAIILFLLNIIILSFLTDNSYANANDLTFNNMNIEQGISQSTVEVIFQDSKGYIWLGTNDGLNRYNGYEYKIYNYEEEKNSISHNGITDITEDNNGYLWVGTVQGVNKIDHENEEIKNYTEENNKIKDDSTSEILKTKDNKILVGTYEGLQIYNEEEDRFDVILDINKGLISNTVYTIDEDKHGNIWVGTDLGVNKISKDFKVLETYKTDCKENSLGEGEIYNIYCDDEYNLVWAGSSDYGLFKIDTKTKDITQYSNNQDDAKSLPANQIGEILRDNNKNLWIGTSGGLACYDEENNNFQVYKNKIYDKNSLVYDNIRSLMQDKEGIIWVGTYSGVCIFDTESTIKHYKSGSDDDYLLSENMVHGVYEDNEGYLWVGSKSEGISIIDRKNQSSTFINTKNNKIIGTDTINDITGYKDLIFVATDNGVFKIDKKSKTTKNFTTKDTKNNKIIGTDTINDITGYKDLIFVATDNGVFKIDKKSKTTKNFTTKDNLVNDAAKDILVDDKGYLWIGTIGGLSVINIETDEVIDMGDYISTDKYIKHMYQKDILVDDKGYLWIGTIGGLSVINIETDEVIDMGDYISTDKYIKHMYQDEEGNYFLGLLKDEGLCYINIKDKTIKYYKHEKNNKTTISSDRIRYINGDSKGNIWVGTSYGLNKFDKKTETFERYTAKDGIANNTIYGVLVDNNDDIWISTNKGISKINHQTNKIENLSVTDGLQGNEFNGNATFKSDSGELLFGGINGLNAFYSADINKVNTDTKVLFDNFIIDNKEYKDINEMKFKSTTDNITIKFFAPIYSSNKSIMYEYKLIGSSGQVYSTKDNYVTYNELPPGKYTFEVRVIDSGGNKSEASSVNFVIRYPLWKSPLALVIYLVIAILLVLRTKYKVKKLDDLVNERTKELKEEIRKNTILHKK